MTDKEALKLALEALKSCDAAHITDGGHQWYDENLVDKAITAIKEALAQSEQEPVAILNHAHGVHTFRNVKLKGLPDGEYLVYTHPPQRTWVGLTEEEIDDIYWQHESKLEHQVFIWPYERTIEAKLKEKNT